jgi:hypothetical protein
LGAKPQRVVTQPMPARQTSRSIFNGPAVKDCFRVQLSYLSCCLLSRVAAWCVVDRRSGLSLCMILLRLNLCMMEYLIR